MYCFDAIKKINYQNQHGLEGPMAKDLLSPFSFRNACRFLRTIITTAIMVAKVVEIHHDNMIFSSVFYCRFSG